MTFELARALLNAEAVTPVPLARALFVAATEGVPLARALVTLNVIKEERLEEELARVDVPTIHHVVPVQELLDLLPAGLCRRLLALPIRRDARTGTVDVAVVDAYAPHAANEIGFFLQAPVRVVRATLGTLEAALDHANVSTRAKAESLAPPIGANAKAKQQTLQIHPSSIPPKPTSDFPMPLLKRTPPPYIDRDDEPPPTVEDDVVLELRPPRAPKFVQAQRAPSVAPASQKAPSPSFPDASSVLAALRSATSRDEILASLLLGVRSVARKAGLLVAKKDHFCGWMCNAEFGESSAFRAVSISANVSSVFATAAAGSTYLGPIYRDHVTAALLDVIGNTSRDVAVTPVRVRGKTAVLIVADELGDTMLGTKCMEDLGRAAGEALARIVRRKA